MKVACNVHPRRRFPEAADLLKTPSRPHDALAFYKELFRIERQITEAGHFNATNNDAERTMHSVAVGTKHFSSWVPSGPNTPR